VTGRTLGPPTIAAFTMLGASEHAVRLAGLVDRLRTDAWWPEHPVPSIATGTPEFDPERYWSGPTWVNTNWLVIEGLHRRGQPALAEELRRRTVALVAARGCAEYFSPVTGEPLGADAFSWTAALVLDLAEPRASD
jgi:glycogen debranching enzyme